MIRTIVIFSLVLSGANWMVFVGSVIVSNLATIHLAFRGAPPGDGRDDAARTRADAGKVIESTGTLAVSLKAAGPAASAAAMSMACLLIAVAAAGIDKL